MFSWLSLGALNHLLGQADWARARLTPYAGKVARLAMPPWQLDFTISAEGCLEAATTAEPDVTMTLPPDAPLRALQGQDKVIAAARVEGNAQFATELSFVLRNLRWDAAGDLSRLVGDVAAQRLVQAADKLGNWRQDAARRLAENIAEYATEESGMLVRPQEVTGFAAELARLDNDIDLLEQRLNRAARK